MSIDIIVLDEKVSVRTEKKVYFKKMVEFLDLRSAISTFNAKVKAARIMNNIYPFQQ